MTGDRIYSYPPLHSGILLKRYKRFFAEVKLSTGEIVTAHCPNTGPMTDVYIPGNPVLLSYSNNPKRKLAYTWEMIQINQTWVGVNTALPNRVIKLALEKYLFPQLGNYKQIFPEVSYQGGKSRVDFVLQGGEKTIYLEVKNTTWNQGNLALFPDTVTTRGQKHLKELMGILPESRGIMLYFINRSDCNRFSPGDSVDKVYGELLRSAVNKGLEILPCRFEITPEGINYLGLAELVL